MRLMNRLNQNSRRRFFGSEVDLLTMDETILSVEQIIERAVPTQHVVINVSKLMMMQRDPKLMEIINSCPVINADGQGIVWGARWMGIPVPERVAGIDLFIKLIERAAQKGYRLYFFGAEQVVVERVVEIFKGQYPSLQVAGWRNGYYKPEEEDEIVEQIRESRADILFVAMSSPMKEFFLKRNLSVMNVPFVMGVGGSFDVVAGKTKRAPLWMQKAGMEWLYRLLCEPSRMFKRYISSNFSFLWLLIKAKLFGKDRYGCS